MAEDKDSGELPPSAPSRFENRACYKGRQVLKAKKES